MDGPDWFCYEVVQLRWFFQLLNLGPQTSWYFRRKSHPEITIFIRNAFFEESCSSKESLFSAGIFMEYILLWTLARVKILDLYHIPLTSYEVPNCPKIWISSYFGWVIKTWRALYYDLKLVWRLSLVDNMSIKNFRLITHSILVIKPCQGHSSMGKILIFSAFRKTAIENEWLNIFSKIIHENS